MLNEDFGTVRVVDTHGCRRAGRRFDQDHGANYLSSGYIEDSIIVHIPSSATMKSTFVLPLSIGSNKLRSAVYLSVVFWEPRKECIPRWKNALI